jgi:uncharacterized protein YegP (UPF0339 family)
MKYWIYKDAVGEWRWTLVAANGRTIADSGEGYVNQGDCVRALQLVKGSAATPVGLRGGR